MALPTLVKTWQFDSNNQVGVNAGNPEDTQRTAFAIKEALTNFGTLPMVVSRSSDGSSTAGAGDKWSTFSDVIVAPIGSNHSWIVLKSQGTIPYEICMDFSDASSHNYELGFLGLSLTGGFNAGAGGTDGSLTTRPTAADEIQLYGANTRWLAGLSTSSSHLSKVHALMSDDGDTMMMIVYINDVPTIVWRFDLLQDPIAGFVNGMHVWVKIQINSTNTLSFSAAMQTDINKWTYDGLSTTRTAYFSYEAFDTTEQATARGFTVANEWDGEWPMYPLGVWTTGTKRGRVGTVSDMWLGSTGTNEADHYPDTGTLHQFAQVGDLIIPWDSTNPLLTS